MKRITVSLLILLAAATSFAQAPRMISYQGVITDVSGNPIPNGNHVISVKLYEQLTGGIVVHAEDFLAPVTNGVFSVTIGSTTPISPALGFDRSYFLGITVDDGVEMIPRTLLTSAPYALRSAIADSVVGGSGGGVVGVTSINGMSGALRFVGAGGTFITTDGDSVVITSVSGGGGGGVGGVQSTDGSLAIANATGPVVTANIAAGGVTTAKLADAAVTSTKLADSSVGSMHIINNSIISIDIADGAVMTVDIADNAVTTEKIVDGAIRTADLANNAVTLAKIDTSGVSEGSVLYKGASGLEWSNISSGITLPFDGVHSSADTLFSITNPGSGSAGHFEVSGESSSGNALSAFVNSSGGSGAAVYAHTKAMGNAGLFIVNSNSNVGPALEGRTSSPAEGQIATGPAGVLGVSTGTGSNSVGVRGMNLSQGAAGIGVIGYQTGSGKGVYGETLHGVGVEGKATNPGGVGVGTGVRGIGSGNAGIGVEAQHAAGGTALYVNNGYITVGGNTRTSFRHTTTQGNTNQGVTTLNYPNPMQSDMLYITHVKQAQNVMGGFGVQWAGGVWTIYTESNVAMPIGEMFNVLVIKQ